MKNTPMPRRKTRLRSRSPIKQGGTPIRPKKRKSSEFARIYGSKARVAFVKAMPCFACGRSPCDNAHTMTGGMGRKASYETIVPLCRADHLAFDERRFPFNVRQFREGIEDYALHVETVWQSHLSHHGADHE